MFVNGAMTGMEITEVTHRLILKVLIMGRAVCFVAAAGPFKRMNVVHLPASAATPSTPTPTASASLGSACPFKFVLKSTSRQVNRSKKKRVNRPTSFLCSLAVN